MMEERRRRQDCNAWHPLEGQILVPLSDVGCFLVTTSFCFEALTIISSAVGCGAKLLVKNTSERTISVKGFPLLDGRSGVEECSSIRENGNYDNF